MNRICLFEPQLKNYLHRSEINGNLYGSGIAIYLDSV